MLMFKFFRIFIQRFQLRRIPQWLCIISASEMSQIEVLYEYNCKI